MKKTWPIGVFDSGVGGLTVVRTLVDKLPGENFIYFGDTAHVPYGNKTREQLFTYAHGIIKFLIGRNCKAIVVACGTHSSVTLPEIAKQYDVPMVGVVKAGARSACELSRNRRIGVMATAATVNSRAFTAAIKDIDQGAQVFESGCPRLVPIIEKGKLDDAEVVEAIRDYTRPLLEEQVDTLILGCTHYPFLADLIQKTVGDSIKLVDPSHETIEQLKDSIEKGDLYNDTEEEPDREFWVSGDDVSFYNVGSRLIGPIIKKVSRIELD